MRLSPASPHDSPGYAITRNGEQITIARGDWEIEVALVAGPQILTESVGITDKLAGLEPAEAESLATRDRHVEVWSDTPDPFMEHFNDYLVVVEVIKTFSGLVAVDPNEPSLL